MIFYRSSTHARRLLWFVWLLLGTCVSAQPYAAGETYFGRNDYIEYRAGDLPLILTAGHGGALSPAEIPDRTFGTTVTDTNTIQLTLACADEIFARTGRRPHVVLSHLRRTKLDPNREIVEAAQGNAFAEQAWNEFHAFITAARDAARDAHGFGHLVDIHGHGHTVQRLELGYGFGATELNQSDAALELPGYSWMSTLRTLHLARPGVPFSDLLRGPRSLGDLFNRRGVPAWPSPDFPSPGDEPFFDGGYIVRQHSCLLDNHTVHGVQIETHFSGVRDNATSRAGFARSLANVLQPYLWDNYGHDLGTLSVTRIEAPATTVLTRGGPALTLALRRTGHLGLSTTLAVDYGGGAVIGQGGDVLTSAPTSVFFAVNQSTTTLTLTPAASGPAFGDKTLRLTLAPSVTQTADTTPLVLTVGDGLGQSVRAHALADSVSEADGFARFRISRTRTDSALAVPLAWSGDTVPEADYHDAPAQGVFPFGVASVEIAVPLVDDDRPGPDKTLSIVLQPGPGFTVGHPASAAVVVRDDDRPAGLAVWLRGELEGNIAVDSSGLERHATTLPANGPLAEGPSRIAAPPDGSAPAIGLDGTDDSVALPRFTLDPEGAFTLAFRFRLDAPGSIANQNIAAYGTRFAPGSLHLYLATTSVTNGTVALRTSLPGLASNALAVTRSSPESWQASTWRHYTLSVTAEGTARVYIDGVLRRTAAGRAERLAADELLWLGWRPAGGGASGFMHGAVRDVRVYHRALPAAEVAAVSSERHTFPAWLTSRGLPAASPALADSDGDSLSLFLEYALAAAPDRPAPAPRWQTGLVDGRLSLSFLRRSDAADLAWIVEASDTLGAWQTLARRASADAGWTLLVPGATVAETNDHVVVTDAPLAPGLARRFLRLRVEAAP